MVARQQIFRRIIRNRHFAGRVFRHQDFQRQINRHAGRRHHQRSPALGIAKYQDLRRRHPQPRFLRLAAVIDHREKRDTLRLQHRLQFFHGRCNAVRASHANDPIPGFVSHVSPPSSLCRCRVSAPASFRALRPRHVHFIHRATARHPTNIDAGAQQKTCEISALAHLGLQLTSSRGSPKLSSLSDNSKEQ